ncbi:DUF6834 family protein [Geoglobus acetivorans]|uniref:Uncharacterized protein n=1 Tax=Geoglobus acetivorans TaxID=565033 RepID=A0A0A7GEQ6_GEOAI|nr:hypothetical protein GACE_0388 [Geoglobus acetivorans]
MDDLREILKKVSELMAGREVTTVEEIKRNAYRAVLSHFLSRHVDRARMEHLVSEVVESLCEVPASINSLHYSEELKVEGVTFRHIHTCKPTEENLENAYSEYLVSKKLIDSIEVMREVTDVFFKGYEIDDGLIRVYSKGKYKYGVFYSLIDDVGEDLEIHERVAASFGGEYVVVVPTENELTRFLRFFSRYSERVKKAGFKVWVVNVEERTIDPFIGYPKDFLLLKGFKNPRVATQINSLWRVQVEEID